MKIEYFLKNGVLDNRALDGGVYVVDLLNDNSKEVIHLYVGEAACIVNRCGKHLMEFSKNTRYFGIKKKYKNNKDLVLRFTVHKHLRKKEEGYDKYYIEVENAIIKKLKPLTQYPNSKGDDMISEPTKTKNVEKMMIEKGFI